LEPEIGICVAMASKEGTLMHPHSEELALKDRDMPDAQKMVRV
jgi:hypothetical protein